MEREHWLLCALIAVPLLYYLTTTIIRPRSSSTTTRRPLPPGPRPLPLLGNLLDLRGGNGNNLHHALARLARVHGPVMRLKLGLTTTIIVSSCDAAREAFTRHDRALSSRAIPDVARAAGFSERSMIWLPAASSDPRWKRLRGVVAAHAFSPRSLAAARAVRERKARDMVRYFRDRSGHGQVVDFGQGVYGGVLNLVSSALFSVDVVGGGDDDDVRGLRGLVEEVVDAIAKPNVSDLFPLLRPLDLQGWRRWTARRLNSIFDILDGIVDRRLSSSPAAAANSSEDSMQDSDFLDALLDLLSEGKMTRDEVTALMFDVFAAGSDTIAITVEWAMAELLRNPSAMARAREEIETSLSLRSKDQESVDERDAVSLPYLAAVVKEAMRLHPVAPIMLPHRCAEDGVEVGGFAVPQGSTVIFNSWAIMRDPAAWERPDEFRPERFLFDGVGAMKVDFRGKNFEFLPFGSGRRVCPGVPMAERVVPLILASLLHAFEWRLPDGMSAAELDVSEKFTTANVMAVPLKAVPFVVNS